MAYDNPAYIKKQYVRTVLDDFVDQQFKKRCRKAGMQRSAYLRMLIEQDIGKEEKLPQKSHG